MSLAASTSPRTLHPGSQETLRGQDHETHIAPQPAKTLQTPQTLNPKPSPKPEALSPKQPYSENLRAPSKP